MKKRGSISFIWDINSSFGLTVTFFVIIGLAILASCFHVFSAVLSFIEYMNAIRGGASIDMLLIILYLLPALLTLLSDVLLLVSGIMLYTNGNADLTMTIGIGLMVLSSISNLIVEASTLSGNGISWIIIFAIVLICYIIIFLYFQGIGNRALAIFAGGLGLACAVYCLINGVILVIHEPRQINGYLFRSYLTATVMALDVLMFILLTIPDNLMEVVDDSDTDKEA